MRLIDATPILQEFIKIADMCEGKNPYENVKIKAYRRCFERIADAPTVDAVPVVYGRWERTDIISAGLLLRNRQSIVEHRCSICDRYSILFEGHIIEENFCPCCGAKMDEVSYERPT